MATKCNSLGQKNFDDFYMKFSFKFKEMSLINGSNAQPRLNYSI